MRSISKENINLDIPVEKVGVSGDVTVASHQPTRSTGGQTEIVFNGEIYNRIGIRNELSFNV